MFSLLSKATLVDDEALVALPISVMFNPTKLSIKRTINWESQNGFRLDAPIREFTGGDGRTLDLDLFFDTSSLGLDVKTWYVDKLEKLTLIDADRHRPPLVKFSYGSTTFIGVITQFDVDYSRFTSSGTPVRADISMTMQETLGAVTTELQSPDHTKLHTVRLGETLDQIAFREYDDPTHWKTIAEANDLADPSRLTPGQRLVLPRLF